jgi:hypothetical protein
VKADLFKILKLYRECYIYKLVVLLIDKEIRTMYNSKKALLQFQTYMKIDTFKSRETVCHLQDP